MVIELFDIVDDLTCAELIKYYEEHPDQWTQDDVQPRFNNTSLDMWKISGPLRKKLEAIKTKILIKCAKHYHLDELYLDWWSICKWEKGVSMDFHADNVTETRDPHHYCWWRNVSAILYLNHDFKGGETVFKYQNHVVVPTRGTAACFPASYSYTHGVGEVTEGTRYTVPLWFTSRADKCWCWD